MLAHVPITVDKLTLPTVFFFYLRGFILVICIGCRHGGTGCFSDDYAAPHGKRYEKCIHEWRGALFVAFNLRACK